MENLSPSILFNIFRHLDTIDLIRSFRVCRRWCVYLWREEEQIVLWTERLFNILKETIYNNYIPLVIKECFQKRELPFNTLNDIKHFNNVTLKNKMNEKLYLIAKSSASIFHLRNLLLQNTLQKNIIIIITVLTFFIIPREMKLKSSFEIDFLCQY